MTKKRVVGEFGLPDLSARGSSIASAWENSLIELAKNGYWYCREDPEDKGPQVDATMNIGIMTPDKGDFYHRGMTCTTTDLVSYMAEIHGAQDGLMKDPRNPKDTRWEYTYNERIRAYLGSKGPIDQLENTIRRLAERPFSRRVSIPLWNPELDYEIRHPACLQRLGFVLTPHPTDPKVSLLNMNYLFRSRNVMVASPMNMVAMYSLMCLTRDELRKRTGRDIQNGRMLDSSDSYHVKFQNQSILNQILTYLVNKTVADEGKKAELISQLPAGVDKDNPVGNFTLGEIERAVISVIGGLEEHLRAYPEEARSVDRETTREMILERIETAPQDEIPIRKALHQKLEGTGLSKVREQFEDELKKRFKRGSKEYDEEMARLIHPIVSSPEYKSTMSRATANVDRILDTIVIPQIESDFAPVPIKQAS